MIRVSYQCREEGSELINHEQVATSYQDVCEVVDNFPWVKEAELSEKYGEGGALFFTLGEPGGKHACFQLTPTGIAEALLDLDIVLKTGVLGLFGRRAVNKHFDVLSVEQAKIQLKELFEHSVDSLYAKYQ